MPDASVRGFTWLIRMGIDLDPDTGELPWGSEPMPTHSWPIAPNERGIANSYGNHAYVAVTERPIPPEVKPGWEVEPAQLDSDFDTAGARLIREAGFDETPLGHISEYVFEVADR